MNWQCGKSLKRNAMPWWLLVKKKEESKANQKGNLREKLKKFYYTSKENYIQMDISQT